MSPRHLLPFAHRVFLSTGAALGLALLVAAGAAPGAIAADRGPYSVEILVDGRPVREFFHDGRTYVEALNGREYSIRLGNHTGERVAIALSVDGLNSIDAKTTTSREAAKWILDPWQSITLNGWQTSSSTARRFFFTTEPESYGAWLGRTKNLGLVAAAVFREKRPQPVPWSRFGTGERDDAQRREGEPPASGESGDERSSALGRASGDGPSAAPAPSQEGDRFREQSDKKALADDLAATGIGRQVGHLVRRVEFEEEEMPAAIVEVRYEFRDALVRLGVVPRYRGSSDRLTRREEARGFEDCGFAPDPYRRSRRGW